MMQGGSRRFCLIPLIAGALLAAAVLNRQLTNSRLIHSPAHAGPGDDGTAIRRPAAPGVALASVLLGGFRGIIADMLWIRAVDLQQRGRYFELVQLADWITALEPQFTEVWALQAWNMAYNISVLMPDDDSRWRWVENGITLLRDRALRANPFDPYLCFELGWLFQHKIGGQADDHTDAYKVRWARHMMAHLAHDRRPGFSSPAAGTPLGDAPTGVAGLDITLMQAIEDRYGALDWRVGEAHAVYWAFAGVLMNPERPGILMCRRMLYQSMVSLFEGGSLTVHLESGTFVFSPDFELLPGVITAFEEALQCGRDTTAPEAYEHFLRRAIRLLVFYHRQTEARQLYGILHARFPRPDTAAGADAFISQPVPPVIPRVIRGQ